MKKIERDFYYGRSRYFYKFSLTSTIACFGGFRYLTYLKNHDIGITIITDYLKSMEDKWMDIRTAQNIDTI